MVHALQLLSSLRLTVALFAMSMFLIFAGTLAQVHDGIWTVMAGYFRTFIAWIDLRLFVPGQVFDGPVSAPFPGGFLLGGLLIVNLLAAHWVRFRFSPRRIGIILLHLGVIILLVGELVTAALAEEALMTIYEGEHVDYVEDVRETELAIIESVAAGEDRVIALPESMLDRAGRTVNHPALPLQITVNRWMPNSRLATSDGATSPATRGEGLRVVAVPQPRVSGIDGNTIDAPSAYITLASDGKSLGVWLVSLHLTSPQEVTVGERTFRLALRFKRTYKPYTMHLLEFRHDRFTGTERPRNFSSRLRLVHPARGEDREVLIRMNHPLRYDGATFYQSAYLEGDAGTVLQVVRNPGWLLPYVACGMVALGMTIHFGMHLVGYLRRAAR